MSSVLSSGSSIHSRSVPKLIQPRQMRLTVIPVFPSVVYSMRADPTPRDKKGGARPSRLPALAGAGAAKSSGDGRVRSGVGFDDPVLAVEVR